MRDATAASPEHRLRRVQGASHRTIAEQVDVFNADFTQQIGPEPTQVFVQEQLDLAAAGIPSGAVAVDLGIITEPAGAVREAHTQLGFDVAESDADRTTRTEVPTILAAVDAL